MRRFCALLSFILLPALLVSQEARDKIIVATQNVNYKEGMELIADEYMKLHPEVEIEMIFITLDYETWVRTQFAGGEKLAPDIYNGNITNSFGRQGKWVALNQFLNKENPYTGKLWSETMEMNLVEKAKEAGNYYHIPLDFIEIGIFYNKDMFKKHGYEVPESWEEMMDLGEQIEQDGYTPFAVPGVLREIWAGQVGWMARMMGDVYYRDLLPLLMPHEGDWDYDPTREGEFVQDLADPFDDMLVGVNQERVHNAIKQGVIDFRDPPTRRIYERIKEWSQYWQRGFLGSDSNVTHRLFLTQEAVMEIHHSGNVTWMIKEMSDLAPEDQFDWGVFSVPSIKNDPLAIGPMRGIGGIGSALTVTKKSSPEHEKNVIDFLMYLTTPENVQTIFDQALANDRPITGPPAVKGVNLDKEIQDRFKPFGGHGYEKLNFRGFDDEQESVYEWSILLQDYLGDRITLDTMVTEYQKVMIEAQTRIEERQKLDLDPATNDLIRNQEQRRLEEQQMEQPIFLTGTFVTTCLYIIFGGFLFVSYRISRDGREKTNALNAYMLLAPTFILVITFMYYPAISGLLAAFTKWEEGSRQELIGFANFTEMTKDGILQKGIWNQIILLVTGLLKATVVPLIIAELVIYLKSQKLQYFFRTAFLIPMIVPAMVTLLIWAFVYDPQTGMLNGLLEAVGLEEYKRTWLGEPDLALTSIIFMGFPWVGAFGFLIYLAGLMNMPASMQDAARMDCLSTFQRILYVHLPMLKGETRILIILTMIGSLQDFQTILILTQGGPGTSTMIPALRMYFEAFRFNQFGYAAALGFMLFLLIISLTMLSYRLLRTEKA